MNSLRPLRILISAGELSGDEHAAHVARALRSIDPSVALRGMGGRNLRAAGVDTVVDAEKSASVMGFQELVGSLGKIVAALRRLKRLIDEWKPDVLVVTDYPDFHIRLAKYARSRGVRTVFYIPPKVWAWRPGRAKKIGATFDIIAAIFPFEPDFYRAFGVTNVQYVGHPIASQISREPLSEARRTLLLQQSDLPSESRVVALFPGSRRFEIERHLPVMAAAVKLINEKHPSVYGLVSIAPTIDPALIARFMPSHPALRTFSGDSIELLKLSDAAALKSGTSNLQAAFCGIPFVMCYWVTRAFETLVVPFLKLKEFSPVNIIRPGTVRELLQKNFSPEVLAEELSSLLFDRQRRDDVLKGLHEVTTSLSVGSSGEQHGAVASSTATRVAQLILKDAR